MSNDGCLVVSWDHDRDAPARRRQRLLGTSAGHRQENLGAQDDARKQQYRPRQHPDNSYGVQQLHGDDSTRPATAGRVAADRPAPAVNSAASLAASVSME